MTDLRHTYHAYVYGTALWYFLRGLMRVINPVAVIGWFRPPADRLLDANDLEIYTTRTDAFGLITLAAILVVVSDAVPLPQSVVGSAFTVPASEKGKKPYAKAIVILTIFHHLTTAMGSYSHWIQPSHNTIAMDIGVYVNIALAASGVIALVYGLGDDESKKKSDRTPKKSKA